MSAPAAAKANGRALRIGAAALLVALVAAAFLPALRWLVERWSASDGYFSHGPLVPLATAWLVWRERARLAATPRRGSWWGLALIVPALAAGVAAALLRLDSPAALALLLLLLPGFVLLFCGTAWLRRLAFPLAFLLFAWPLPMFATVDAIDLFKRIVVPGSCALVNLFGAHVTAQGSFLLLPDGGRLLVDDECSGLKSALALVALGAFMAGTARGLTGRGRLLLFLLALPIALLANVVRVALLAAIGSIGGAARAGRLHDPSTWAVYAIAIALYLLVEWGLRRRARATGTVPPQPDPAADGSTKSVAGGAGDHARCVVALVLVGASAAATWRADRPRPKASTGLVARIAREISGWSGADRSLTPRQYDLLETRDVLLRNYVRGGDEVLACVAMAGAEGKAAHPPEICYRGQGFDVVDQRPVGMELAGRRRVVDRLRVRQGRFDLLVWSWYRVGATETPDWKREQWLALSATVAGRDERAALLRFSTPVRRDGGADATVDDAKAEAAADARLHAFVENFLPAFDAALAGAAAGGESHRSPANGK